jgi:hypothetical protein
MDLLRCTMTGRYSMPNGHTKGGARRLCGSYLCTMYLQVSRHDELCCRIDFCPRFVTIEGCVVLRVL